MERSRVRWGWLALLLVGGCLPGTAYPHADRPSGDASFEGDDDDDDEVGEPNDGGPTGLPPVDAPDGNSCSVGDCCVPLEGGPIPAALDFASCEEASCFGMVIGAPPTIDEDGLAPAFETEAVSGTYVGDPIDLASHHLTFDVRFGVPSCRNCSDAVAVGWVGESLEAPIAALVLRGSENDVAFVVGEEVVYRFADVKPDDRFVLEVDPSGIVQASRVADSRYEPTPMHAFAPGLASLAIFGRNRNPSSGESIARVQSLVVRTKRCDRVDAWDTPTPVSLGGATSHITSPSVATYEGQTWLAYMDDGTIDIARQSQSADTFDVLRGARHELPSYAASYGDPEIVAPVNQNTWSLYFTATDEDGVEHIARARTGNPEDGFEDDDGFVLSPDGDVAGYAEPTALVLGPTGWKGTLLVVRETRIDGSTRLALFASMGTDDAPFSRLDVDLADVSSRSALDGETLGAPSLAMQGNSYVLYYAQRVGARWSVGLLVSANLTHWTDLGEVLRPSVEIDRLGVADPDVLITTEAVELYYGATNGVRDRLGRTRRALPQLR